MLYHRTKGGYIGILLIERWVISGMFCMPVSVFAPFLVFVMAVSGLLFCSFWNLLSVRTFN